MKYLTLLLSVLVLSACGSTPIYKMQNCIKTGEDEGNSTFDCQAYKSSGRQVR